MSEEVKTEFSPIVKPLIEDKKAARILKLIKKAKDDCFIGVKAVSKALRNNKKGILILAGDISPIDVISHFPVYCEEKGVRYGFIKYKQDIGTAFGSKRGIAAVFIPEPADDKCTYAENYQKCEKTLRKLYKSEFGTTY